MFAWSIIFYVVSCSFLWFYMVSYGFLWFPISYTISYLIFYHILPPNLFLCHFMTHFVMSLCLVHFSVLNSTYFPIFSHQFPFFSKKSQINQTWLCEYQKVHILFRSCTQMCTFYTSFFLSNKLGN